MDEIMKSRILQEEVFSCLCGKYLGAGIHREVFEYKPDPKWVIKIDIGDRHANIMEEEIWAHVVDVIQKVGGRQLKDWFAPVKQLSPCGRVVLQRKCNTKFDRDKFPKKIPDFFSDTKYQNWGLLNGLVVCFDYANNLALTNGLFTGKMKPANWWE